MTSGFIIGKVAHSLLHPVLHTINHMRFKYEQTVCLHSVGILVNSHFNSFNFSAQFYKKLLQAALYKPGCVIPGFYLEDLHMAE